MSADMADQSEMKSQEGDLPPDIKYWSKHQVRDWVLKLDGVDDTVADILLKQDISGPSLLLLNISDFRELGVSFGPAKLIIHTRDELVKSKKEEQTSAENQPGKPCKPYPFGRYDDTFRYMESSILDVTESGASDLIQPCHEYKAFINTTDETKMSKFTTEVIRFAAACMNNRTNGTIHFGIGDKPHFTHGQVLGVTVTDIEGYNNNLRTAIDSYFKGKYKEDAHNCIKHPRFVGVLNKNMTSSDKWVIEVDIVPDYMICGENIYYTDSRLQEGKKKSKGKAETCFFVRDGGSSRDLLAPNTSKKAKADFKRFVDGVAKLSQLRKKAEEKNLSVIKNSTQGSRLSHMITGGSLSLDRSHFENYVIVTNKSDSRQFEYLEFLVTLDPTAVLDFDPESASDHGLQHYFDQKTTLTPHSPVKYKITEGVEDTARKLQLPRKTSWVFCNGGIEHETPSDIDQWLIEKGASVRDVISFLCRKDVLPDKRFLVVFLLLSTVSEKMDPLVETFSTFWQELGGTNQILCICDNEKAFTSWRDLIEARCEIDISGTCIYELSFAEINGTVLSLWSTNRTANRFLPCGGGSRVPLQKEVEHSLTTLEILCENQCEGGNEDKIDIEENFYRGGKVSWWNFYFSEQPGSTAFIKRDKFDYITKTVMLDLCSLRKACVLLNLMHVPGCGGTTLAMHTLWALRDRFRCAVLRTSNADFAEVADQVVKLLTYDHKEQSPRVPVLLMIDDFDDMEKVSVLQELIEKECVAKGIQSKSAQVIVLNCMRLDSSELTKPTLPHTDTVCIENVLSDKEQKLFNEKLTEIEKTHKNAETFYGFMILKTNFSLKYIEDVVSNTLKGFNKHQKHEQLLAVLVLLNVYCKGSSLSVSLCEKFVNLQPTICGTIKDEDLLGKFSNFITRCWVAGLVLFRFRAVKMIHSSIAKQCLEELTTKHNVTKVEIINLLLTTDELYESTQGKNNLLQDVRQILVRRHRSTTGETQFSPLIQEIASETPGLEEMVLRNASKRFERDAIISQLLARYYYLRKKDFSEAKVWATKARDLSNSSYIADTSVQAIKHELVNAIANNKEEPIGPDKLNMFLKMAQSAKNKYMDAQNLAKKESFQRLYDKADNCPINTAGYLGEIQVGVLLIDVLVKTPVFSFHKVRHDIMSQVLSGDQKLQDVERSDPQRDTNKPYYDVLRQFEDVLYNLRNRMKVNFDFFDNYYVNLGSNCGLKDYHEQVFQKELSRCFEWYAELFCETDSLLKCKTMSIQLKLHQTRQFLEKTKADTYSGILNYLSNDIPTGQMEEIARQYRFVDAQKNLTLKEKVNFIYVNVVLSRIKPESQVILPYNTLAFYLVQVLREKIPESDMLPVLFIAVVLLWPPWHSAECRHLTTHISQMKTNYHSQMSEVYNGKYPVVHFLLGRKQGYERLVHMRQIEKCIEGGQEQFASLWRNGKIWKEKKVQELLCRVTGEVKGNSVLADTCYPDLKIEVAPMHRSQIIRLERSKVSFFIGFSMKGPLALDIEPKS